MLGSEQFNRAIGRLVGIDVAVLGGLPHTQHVLASLSLGGDECDEDDVFPVDLFAKCAISVGGDDPTIAGLAGYADRRWTRGRGFNRLPEGHYWQGKGDGDG